MDKHFALEEGGNPKKWGTVLPIYGIGFFSLSLQPMTGLLVPLWALEIGASPFLIGLSVSAGSLIPTLFSISIGAMVDELGSNRVMWFGSLAIAALSMLQPLFPFIAVLILIQLLYGQIQAVHWIAAQTYVAKWTKRTENRSHMGRFSFFVNLGAFVGPMLLGIVWDMGGPLAAFAALSVWAMCLCWVSTRLPVEDKRTAAPAPGIKAWNRFMPKWRDYRNAFAMLAIPAVFLVMYGTFLRLAGFSMKGSFFLVYLNELAFPATAISFLFSLISLVGVFSSLIVDRLSRLTGEEGLLILALIIGIVPLSLTPMFHDFWGLAAISVISGFGLGLTFPLLMTILSRSVGPGEQGLSIGLRSTINRLASTLVPLLFGLLAEGFGLHISFFVVGGLLIIPFLVFAPMHLSKTKALRSRERSADR